MIYDLNEITDEKLQANYLAPEFIDYLKHTNGNYEQLRRVDLGSCRYYYTKDDNDNINLHPGVTSVLHNQMPLEFGLLQWYATNGMEKCKEILFERALYGTLMHIVFSKYIALPGNSFNKAMIDTIFNDYVDRRPYHLQRTIREYYETERYIDDLYKDLLCFHAFIIEKNVRIIANEISLCTGDYNPTYAGTIDLICELDFNKKRQTAIIDFKSKRGGASYSSNVFQLHAYRQLWNRHFVSDERYEDGSSYIDESFKIDMAFNFFPNNWQKEPTYKLTNQTKKINDEKIDSLFENYLCNFHLQSTSKEALESKILNIDQTIKKGETFVASEFTLKEYLLNY